MKYKVIHHSLSTIYFFPPRGGSASNSTSEDFLKHWLNIRKLIFGLKQLFQNPKIYKMPSRTPFLLQPFIFFDYMKSDVDFQKCQNSCVLGGSVSIKFFDTFSIKSRHSGQKKHFCYIFLNRLTQAVQKNVTEVFFLSGVSRFDRKRVKIQVF